VNRAEILKYSTFNPLPISTSGNYAVLLVYYLTTLLSWSR